MSRNSVPTSRKTFQEKVTKKSDYVSILILLVPPSARPEQSKQVVHAKFIVLHPVATQCGGSECTLFLLQLEDSILNSVLHGELIDVHGARLAEAVSAVEGLVLWGRAWKWVSLLIGFSQRLGLYL